jgi:cytosine/adenosine deaminase-related metal-dependent hydrolase
LRGAAAIIDDDGTVLGIEEYGAKDSSSGTEFFSGILLPGLVNAHCHLELSHLRGAIAEGGGFAAFGRGMGEVRDHLSDADKLSAAEYADARMFADGVSAVGDICNSGLTARLKSRSKISYHSFLELYGLNAHSLGRLPEIADTMERSGLRHSFTPHSCYSLNEEAFALAVGGADNSPLSIHFMESEGERDLFHGGGELRAWYDERGFTTDFTERYASPADRIVRNIPPDRPTLLIHNTCITERDIEMLAAHFGRNLTFVLCPRSNIYISGKLPPTELLRRSGCRIAIGTDSLASNHSLSMVEEMKLLTDIPLEELLRMATISGAEALGIADTHGSLAPGKRPGLALLTGLDWPSMTLTPAATIRRIVYPRSLSVLFVRSVGATISRAQCNGEITQHRRGKIFFATQCIIAMIFHWRIIIRPYTVIGVFHAGRIAIRPYAELSF